MEISHHTMSERKPEVRGKSWRREREERGRRQMACRESFVQNTESCATDNAKNPDNQQVSEQRPDVIEGSEKKIRSETNCEEKKPCTEWRQNLSTEEIETLSRTRKDSSDKETLQPDIEFSGLEATSFLDVKEDTVSSEGEGKKQLEQFVAEVTEKLRSRAELRSINTNAAAIRPEESFFSKLDSSLKKNTAFIKRLRNMTEAQKDSLIKDMNALNLTKYISEAAAAIVDAKLKMSDVNAALQICSLLHQRYSDFCGQLLENWQKVLPMKKDEKITNPSKIRVDLRFYAELISCGVFTLKEGLPLLGNLLTVLTQSDKEEHSNLNILLSFCRHCGEDYAGLIARKFRILAYQHVVEIPKSDLLPADRQKGLRALLKDYYKSLCKHLVRDYKCLQNMERQNRRILQTKGELCSDRKEKYEACQSAFQKLLSSTQQFADILDEDVPNLPKDECFNQDSEAGTLDIHNRFKDGEAEAMTSIWEDDDTRSFYENLPDLKAFIPGILFKDSSQSTSQPQGEIQEDKLEEDLSKLEIEEGELLETEGKEEIDLKETSIADEKDLAEALMQETEDAEEDSANTSSANKLLLEGFLLSLLHCVNREMIDQAAVDFCMNLNTKPNRKKLVKALFLVPRTRLDLLPFYARFVATLNPCMPDVASDLVTMLKQDFKFHIKKKDQINIESKVKTVRFIGELVKFKIFPKSEALYCLKLLLFDFIHHHVEMACNLLETCGRFLFRAPDSHQRTKVYLEQMMRKKSVLPLDSRYTTMIENAFYYCNPPETAPTVLVERPPMHEYIRKLLYKDLTKTTTEKILRQMRKLDWEDPEVAAYATKCLTAIWNVKYYNIRCVANLLAGLVAYQENVGPQVVDGVLEDIRLGMEVNHPKYNQRRVSMVRYLGELYNYRMVESTVIFRVLYSFITFGVSYDGSYSELDPPDNLFRIRLICILLDTCGQYFNSGSSKKKLDCFLVFFQRYFWHKKSVDLYNDDYPFPVTVQFMVTDTVSALRPKLKLYESLEEAEQGAEDLTNELRPKLVEVCPSLKTEDDDENNAQPANKDDSLGPIQEVDEEQDDDGQSESSFQEGETDTDGFSGSQSQPLEDENDVSGRHCNSLSDENSDRMYDGSQDAPVVTSAPKHVHCAEDEDFMAAFDRMLSESILHRNQESVKPQVDIVIPMNIKGNPGAKKITVIQNEMKLEEKPTVNFVLMTRRGNKQQFKNLAVPVTSELAQNLKDREEAERVEKQQVKQLTLNINERQEEEDYQEMLAAQQRPAVMNLNRDRRQKYHHPKGAPDADLIFGNKKR